MCSVAHSIGGKRMKNVSDLHTSGLPFCLADIAGMGAQCIILTKNVLLICEIIYISTILQSLNESGQ